MKFNCKHTHYTAPGGEVFLGDIHSDVVTQPEFEITFPSIGAASYQVLSSFKAISATFTGEFDYDIAEQTQTSFKLRFFK